MAEEKIEESSFTQAVDKPTESQEGENTSGRHSSVPPEIQGGWNWGAFFLTGIWGISHGVWIALLVFVVPLPMQIILGIKGNEWAWQNRRFESIDQFREVQRKWTIWGIILSVVGFFVMAGIMAVVVLVSFSDAREKAREEQIKQQKQFDQINKGQNDYYDNLFKKSEDSATDEL